MRVCAGRHVSRDLMRELKIEGRLSQEGCPLIDWILYEQHFLNTFSSLFCGD